MLLWTNVTREVCGSLSAGRQERTVWEYNNLLALLLSPCGVILHCPHWEAEFGCLNHLMPCEVLSFSAEGCGSPVGFD